MANAPDLTGKRFGKLTVIARAPRKPSTATRNARWVCRCDCGAIRDVRADQLKRGIVTSCHKSKLTKRRSGDSKTRLHGIWSSMVCRCHGKYSRLDLAYGGRGISVCNEWRSDFDAFKAWALANGYADDLTIDRIDNDGNYEPGNCRWATRREQARNKRNNRFLTVAGERLTVSDAAKRFGLHRQTVTLRLNRGLSGEEAIRPVINHA